MSYYYRREDNGRLEKVDYSHAIEQDEMGYITVKGIKARRVHSMDPEPIRKKKQEKGRFTPKPILSDTLGVTASQLTEMEADRKINGFNGVEFVPDPTVKGFYQARIDSDKGRWKYAEHRGMKDGNSRNGGNHHLTKEDLAKAKILVERS